MLSIRVVRTSTDDVFSLVAARGIADDAALVDIVGKIILDVRARGDEALLDQARKFDSPSVNSLVASADESRVIPGEFRSALLEAHRRITDFHRAQLAALTSATVPDELGVRWELEGEGVGQRMLPVRRAGVYVPGGRAAYPSSVLMNALPAQVAGVPEIVVATPCGADGTLLPAVLAACDLVGVSRVAKVGGAAAIAAMTFGTESVPCVDVIVGPGNRFVNEAKRQLWGRVGLDGYAGPSEVCVLIDETTEASFAAADLLTQIEHAPDNAGFLVSTSEAKLNEVLAEMERQVNEAPRGETMREALRDHGLAVLVRDLDEACDVINAIAPEHCSLAIADAERALAKIHSAGCILVGEWSAESAGDYAAGPSHTLPTSGAARFGSPVNVLHFLKVQSVIGLSREQAVTLAPTIEAFGAIEGFPQHALGGRLRRLRSQP